MSIEKAQAQRKDDYLAKLIHYTEDDGTKLVLTHKAYVERMILQKGYAPCTWQENKIKNMSRLAYFRATQQEQDAHERRQKAAGTKTCYGFRNPENGDVCVASKIEYDYALSLAAS